MRIKKENLVVIFYVLYFTWLFMITYLRVDAKTVNIFSVSTVIFYFIFLREKRDLFWFWLGVAIPVIANSLTFSAWVPEIDYLHLLTTPIWLPLMWGTTFVALRKFYLMIVK